VTEADVALACMGVFARALVERGLRDACVSPGSRSTPLALALHRDPDVRVHVHLDERSAAFFALGLAKASGRPVALACTSGTAAAEYLPAMVEASLARVPLIVLTADRPAELRGVGANQTIDQPGLYGGYVRASLEAEVPGDRPEGAYWRGLATNAWWRAVVHPPRPVHVNLPFREPLVPAGPPVELDAQEPVSVDMEARAPYPEPADAAWLASAIDETERGVVLVGSLRDGGREPLELAATVGWPLLAEPTSGARLPGALAAGQSLLGDEVFADAHVPELVLQIGAAPTSRPALALVARTPRLVIVDPDDLVADPHRRAGRRIVAHAATTAMSVLHRSSPRSPGDWTISWREADTAARGALDALLDVWDEPSEPRVARDLAAAMPAGSTLVVGSSMPIRDLDLAMGPREGLRVLANRGASGIDGAVSTVLGVAAAGAPTVGLLGDLSFLHDAGGLLWNARRGLDAVLVVVNNGGGAIFSLLGQRELPTDELATLFTTAHGLDLGAVCAAGGAGHTRVERAEDLVPAVDGGRTAGGVHVVEVVVDAEHDRRRRAELRQAVGSALASAS
jgi:2-succinyl-5-enolpyruvyl-6-hydroxy-3-cyclohexene-1-carboxylate synthase